MAFRRRFRLCLKVLISMACIVLCSYQIYVVGRLYLSYPTTVDIRIGRSMNVHLPGITICSEIATTILIENILEFQPNLIEVFAGKTKKELSELLRKKTYRQLLEDPLRRLPIHLQHKNTISATKFFDICELPTPIGYQKGLTYNYKKVNCSAISKIVESISFDKKCFTLFYNNEQNYEQNPNYKIKRDAAANLKYLAWIRINRDYISNGLIYIHPPKVFHQYSDGNNVLQIDPNKNQFMAVSFSRQTTRLLPPPYATKCKNYSEEGFNSRDHCLAQCKIDAYLQEDGWPGDMFATNNITYSFSKLWINSWSPSGHLEEGLTLDDKCADKCGDSEDCESVFYDVKALRVIERDVDDLQDLNFITIGILPPKSVDMTSVHMPKLESIELAVYVGSLISLYLGVSVVSVFVAIFAFVTFTGTPMECLSADKNKNNKVKQMNGNHLYEMQTRDNTFNDNNNSTALMQRQYYQPVVELRPRPRLPGILHFMFES